MKEFGRLGGFGGMLLAAGFVLALVFAGGSIGANGAEYSDPVGDSGTAADISSVVISNDDSGVLTFQLNFANRPQFTNGAVNLYIDADQNPSTGVVGSEYRMRWYANDSQPLALERWDGSGYIVTRPPSFSASMAPNRITFTVNRADIGTTNGLSFFVNTAEGGTDYLPDTATGGARASYTVIVGGPATTTTPPAATTTPPATTPPATTAPAPGPSPEPPPSTQPAVSTPVSAQPASVPDSDRDGIPDRSDACPSKAAGRFDANKNGCSGPFAAINARVGFQLRVPPLQFRELRIKGVPFKGTVEIRMQGFVERLVGSGSIASRRLLGRTLPEGAMLELRVFKAGWIGYFARLRVSSNGVAVMSRQCLPPSGGKTPTPCGAALRGK